VKIDGRMVEQEVGEVKRRKVVQRPRYYDETVVKVLKVMWESFDYMCGQRLASIIREMLPVLVGSGKLYCSKKTYEKLLRVSGATIDRLLREDKVKMRLRGCSHTKATSMLKAEIPVRTWSVLEVEEYPFVDEDGVETENYI